MAERLGRFEGLAIMGGPMAPRPVVPRPSDQAEREGAEESPMELPTTDDRKVGEVVEASGMQVRRRARARSVRRPQEMDCVPSA
jgi:hypothetical protein